MQVFQAVWRIAARCVGASLGRAVERGYATVAGVLCVVAADVHVVCPCRNFRRTMYAAHLLRNQTMMIPNFSEMA